jgi:hypothetical protein
VAEELDKNADCHRLGENEVLHRVTKLRNISQTEKRRKVNWIGHILFTTCLIKEVTEGKRAGKIGVTGRGGKTLSSYWMTLRKRKDTEI